MTEHRLIASRTTITRYVRSMMRRCPACGSPTYRYFTRRHGAGGLVRSCARCEWERPA